MNWTPIQTGWSGGYFETIDPQQILQYQECQPRVNGLDPNVVAEYAMDMRNYDEAEKGIPGWQKFPHICCVKTRDDRHILVSGFHRLDAIFRVGYERIEVYCIDGTRQDAILLSKGENANNGVRRTNADKEYIVRSCLLDAELRKWSNEQIAEWCGVAPNTVKNHEDRLCIIQREKGEAYDRPVIRLFMKKDGTVGEKDTSEIGNRSSKTEAAIAVLKPRFQNAVETWRSSQVERLQKFERLPVGRTPLLEAEYIKTYFELADPRISQNTKPTAAHYEGAIECMRDRPVAFAKQLEGRHYRRIIEEWDESVLPQLIKRFQGHLLGYPTSQLKAEAFEVRIKRAIRRQYEFQGRIPSQPFEILFEITEDAHAVLVQLNPKEWVRDGREISWALLALPEPTKTSDEGETGENVSEETLKGLWKLVTGEMKAWKARDKEKCRFPSDHIGKASKSMLITALRKDEAHNTTGKATAAELRDLLRLMKTDTFSFTLRVREILKSTEKAAIDLECAHGNAEDARRRVWIAFGKSDISQSVGKKDFALAAAKHHDLYMDDYSSAENYLLGEAYAPIDKLSLKEAQQLRAFFNSVERAIQEHPDWIQALLSETETPNATDAEEVSPMDPVWDVFNEHYPKWKAKYAESGCDENELIQASTESELLDALRVYRESDREGMPTADEVKDMINLMKRQSYPLARHLRNLLRAEVDAQDEGETEPDPFHDVDLATVKADLEALIKKVMPPEKHPLWHQICEDINDAYLDYENLPNDREIFAILLDCALTAIDELP